MDGQSVEIVAGQLMPEGAEPTAPASTRPIPVLGHILCQVCHRPTNSEVQNDMVDTPFVFNFKGAPRAIICWECYMNGTIMGAMLALQAPAKEACCAGPACETVSDELPRGSANG